MISHYPVMLQFGPILVNSADIYHLIKHNLSPLETVELIVLDMSINYCYAFSF